MRFNSKLVRLKVLDEPYPKCLISLMFQFQTGSIKSSQETEDYLNQLDEFQFQTGSIKSVQTPNQRKRVFTCFNSKLVRLKDVEVVKVLALDTKFQFQTGSIKSV